MFQLIKNLRRNRKKVLGINERFLEYIRPYNKSNAFRIADDKVLTKKILKKHGIAVPAKLALIKSEAELREFDFSTLPKSFVIKPVNGSKGGGIEIFYNRDKTGNWIRANKSKVSESELRQHLKDILDGKYSINYEPDLILIEERISPTKTFRYHTFKGAPDIRVIVFNNMPVMAMLRLPTEKSGGKANLDMGGIGAGIDMAVGKTTNAISGKSGQIERVPHTRLPIAGLRIPYWNAILENSIKAAQVTGLGYAGIDFLIDKDKGPVIIELNARPGLSIQLANGEGIRKRLRKAHGLKIKSIKQGVRLAKDLFGGEIEEEIEAISGKDVIGIYENVTVSAMHGKFSGKAKIDTGADRSSIDRNIAIKIGFNDFIHEFEQLVPPDQDFTREEAIVKAREIEPELLQKYEYLSHLSIVKSSHGVSLRPSVKISLKIQDTEFSSIANIYNRSKLEYQIIVGRKSLSKFLIDPSKII